MKLHPNVSLKINHGQRVTLGLHFVGERPPVLFLIVQSPSVIVKVWLAPWVLKKLPDGDIEPPVPADAVSCLTASSEE